LDPLRRRAGDEFQFAVLLPEIGQRSLGQLDGDLTIVAAFDSEAVEAGDLTELDRILDGVIAGLILRSKKERMGDVATVVGMRGRAGSDHPNEIARCDGIDVCAADATLRLPSDDPAGSHAADPATEALGSELALRLHRVPPIPGG
jgi:hypothetical protein